MRHDAAPTFYSFVLQTDHKAHEGGSIVISLLYYINTRTGFVRAYNAPALVNNSFMRCLFCHTAADLQKAYIPHCLFPTKPLYSHCGRLFLKKLGLGFAVYTLNSQDTRSAALSRCPRVSPQQRGNFPYRSVMRLTDDKTSTSERCNLFCIEILHM